MPSILTQDKHKIAIRSDNLNKDIVFLSVVKSNGESMHIELTQSEISEISSMIDNIMLHKEINEEIA